MDVYEAVSICVLSTEKVIMVGFSAETWKILESFLSLKSVASFCSGLGLILYLTGKLIQHGR